MSLMEEIQQLAREDGRDEGREEASENIAVNFIKTRLVTLEQIAKACNLSLARVQELTRMNS